MAKRLKPSQRAKQKSESTMAAGEGVQMMNYTQAMDDKENMRPNPDNAKMVRQGRMLAKNGMNIATPKTIKANTYAQTRSFRSGYDGIKWG